MKLFNIKRKKQLKSVVIFGLGTFGMQIAKNLHERGVFVIAIDKDQSRVDKAATLASKAICTEATNMEVIKSHDIFDVDTAIIALKQHFDITVIITNMLKKGGVEEIIVQVASELQADAIKPVGATHVIFPQLDMAKQIAKRMVMPGIHDYVPLAKDFSIIHMPIPERFVNQTLIDLQLRNRFKTSVIAIQQSDGEFIGIPSPNAPLQPGCELYIMGANDNLENLQEYLSE